MKPSLREVKVIPYRTLESEDRVEIFMFSKAFKSSFPLHIFHTTEHKSLYHPKLHPIHTQTKWRYSQSEQMNDSPGATAKLNKRTCPN